MDALHVVEISPGRQKRVYALRQLALLGLEMPDLQRPADTQRVDNIVAYQTARGIPLFVGDLLVSKQGERFYVVDGQHRLLAMLRLALTHPEAPASIEVIDAAVMSMRELFVTINRATPVPDYIIDGTLNAARRRVLDACATLFRTTFPKFISSARSPRRPNVSLDRLLDRMAASDVLLSRFGDGEQLFMYITWASARLEATDIVNTRLAKAKAEPALFLTSDPDDVWTSDTRLIDTFINLSPPWTFQVSTIRKVSTTRRPLSTSLRNAVWNAAFGGPGVGEGPCHCCKRTVSHQDFECGHIIAAARGGCDVVSNLRVVCRSCNRGMGIQDMREFSAAFKETQDTKNITVEYL